MEPQQHLEAAVAAVQIITLVQVEPAAAVQGQAIM
jgi:hypothetical protein